MVKFLLSADPNNSVIHADNPNSIKNRIKIINGANQDQDLVTYWTVPPHDHHHLDSRLNDVEELEWMLPRNMR